MFKYHMEIHQTRFTYQSTNVNCHYFCRGRELHLLDINTVTSGPVDTPLLQTLATTDKIQIPGESYRGLTENDSRHYELSLLRNYGYFGSLRAGSLVRGQRQPRTGKAGEKNEA